MRINKSLLYCGISAFAMAVLILDTATGCSSASAAIQLCIRSVIPSLFPFIFLSALLTGNLSGKQIAFLKPLGKLMRIPRGSEILLLTGFLGGYPVGAQSITAAYNAHCLSKDDAHRMLGFCSNAGPSFIFGILGPLFSTPLAGWSLWLIHILSALLTGCILPGGSTQPSAFPDKPATNFSDALSISLKAMASICGWIIIFRVIIGFFQRWFLWMLPEIVEIFLIGVLELTNGCYALSTLSEENAFLFSSVMLGFGGFCIGMQTVSVTGSLGTGCYFTGKILQACISILLAAIASQFLFRGNLVAYFPAILIAMGVILLFIGFRKNNCSIFVKTSV